MLSSARLSKYKTLDIREQGQNSNVSWSIMCYSSTNKDCQISWFLLILVFWVDSIASFLQKGVCVCVVTPVILRRLWFRLPLPNFPSQHKQGLQQGQWHDLKILHWTNTTTQGTALCRMQLLFIQVHICHPFYRRGRC